jgi:hypothetical protein
MGRVEVYTGFWWGILTERVHLEDAGLGGRIILRCIFREWYERKLTGSSWLRIGRVDGHL